MAPGEWTESVEHPLLVDEVVERRLSQLAVAGRLRRWWKQFRELVSTCIVRDLERIPAMSHDGDERSYFPRGTDCRI